MALKVPVKDKNSLDCWVTQGDSTHEFRYFFPFSLYWLMEIQCKHWHMQVLQTTLPTHTNTGYYAEMLASIAN